MSPERADASARPETEPDPQGLAGAAAPAAEPISRDPGLPLASVRLAVGIGFRKACTVRSMVDLVRAALARAALDHPWSADRSAVLATIAEKDRPSLHEAAAELGLEVLVLSKAALLGTEDRITVASAAAQACFGIPSVAEAAALAAAGPGSRLIVPRIAMQDATCAIAASAGPA